MTRIKKRRLYRYFGEFNLVNGSMLLMMGISDIKDL
jgi:hypothetical protein